MREDSLGLALLCILVAVSGWSWHGRRQEAGAALAYAARAYPGATARVGRPAEGAACGVVAVAVEASRWFLFDPVRGQETEAVDQAGLLLAVRSKLRLLPEASLTLVSPVPAGQEAVFSLRLAAGGDGPSAGTWDLDLDVQSCRLTAVALRGSDGRHIPLMKPVGRDPAGVP